VSNDEQSIPPAETGLSQEGDGRVWGSRAVRTSVATLHNAGRRPRDRPGRIGEAVGSGTSVSAGQCHKTDSVDVNSVSGGCEHRERAEHTSPHSLPATGNGWGLDASTCGLMATPGRPSRGRHR
jgi:hypothetical protein